MITKKNNTNTIVKNVFLSVFVQLISLFVSFLINLIVPRFISEYQYAYWQTYILYVNYVGILHFGLLDGIVLRYSQYDYEDLDKTVIRSQFKVLLGITTSISIASMLVCGFLLSDIYRNVFWLVSIGMVTKNLVTYTSYTFQITNRINRYATVTIAQRVFFGIAVSALLLFKVTDFYWFCIADLCGDIVAIFLGALFNKGLYFGKSISIKETIKETKTNISSGFLLLIANWSSILLIGSAKMIVQWRWDELVFGKVSFSFSVSNLFLTFVTAISVVLFPTLKRMEQDKLPSLYRSIRNTISPVLFYAMLCYFPGCWILEKWLPAYQPSLVYLGILLPIIIYTSKVSLLTNNYLKAYRKEKAMLIINVVSVLVAFVLFALSAYVFNDLTMLLVCIVLVIMGRSIVSEIVVMKMINIKFVSDFVIEAIMTVLFILCAKAFSLWVGFLIYFVCIVFYSIYYRNNLKAMLRQVFGKLKRAKA